MIQSNMVVSHPAFLWAAKFVFWLCVIGLVGFALIGCSTFGIATEDQLAERVDALNEARIETAVAIVEPLEPLVPGITAYAESKARGVMVRAPPPPQTGFPWLEIVSIVGAAVGVSVPAAVKATNMIRDNRRVALGQPTKAHPLPKVKAPESA